MDTHQRRLRVALFVMTGTFILSLFLMLAALKPSAYSFISQGSTVLIASFLIFLLSPIVLLATVWRGVWLRDLDKMDG